MSANANQRIQELAEQAHSYACEYAQQPDYNPHNPYNQSMYKQRYDSKFAELIVRECIDIIEKLPPGYKDYRNQIEDAFRIASVVEIKNRFGVK